MWGESVVLEGLGPGSLEQPQETEGVGQREMWALAFRPSMLTWAGRGVGVQLIQSTSPLGKGPGCQGLAVDCC